VVKGVRDYGEIRSDWEKSGTSVKMNVTIPANSTALVYVPANSGSVIKEDGKGISGVKNIQVIGEENGRKILKVGSGEYKFESLIPSPSPREKGVGCEGSGKSK